jgi:hypothetical protein
MPDSAERVRVDGLYLIRLVAALTSILATGFYIVTGRTDLTTLLALMAWNLACLGLYRWHVQ